MYEIQLSYTSLCLCVSAVLHSGLTSHPPPPCLHIQATSGARPSRFCMPCRGAGLAPSGAGGAQGRMQQGEIQALRSGHEQGHTWGRGGEAGVRAAAGAAGGATAEQWRGGEGQG
jgi:hypothetical protein